MNTKVIKIRVVGLRSTGFAGMQMTEDLFFLGKKWEYWYKHKKVKKFILYLLYILETRKFSTIFCVLVRQKQSVFFFL